MNTAGASSRIDASPYACSILQNVPPLWSTVDNVSLHIEQQCKCTVAYAIPNVLGKNTWLVKFDPVSFNALQKQVIVGLKILKKNLKIKVTPFGDKVFEDLEAELCDELREFLSSNHSEALQKRLKFEIGVRLLEKQGRWLMIGDFYQILSAQNMLTVHMQERRTSKKENIEVQSILSSSALLSRPSIHRQTSNSTFNVVALDRNLYVVIKQSPYWGQLRDWVRNLSTQRNANVYVEETSSSQLELSCLHSSAAGTLTLDDAVSELHDLCKQIDADIMRSNNQVQQVAIPLPPIFKHLGIYYDKLFQEALKFCKETFKEYDKSFSLKQPSKDDSSHLYINVYSVVEPLLSDLQWKVRLFVRHFVLLRVASLPIQAVQLNFELKKLRAYEYTLTGFDNGSDKSGAGGKSTLKILVYDEDVTLLCVDAVVNAANDRLDHSSGLAGALRKAAGDAFVQESLDYVAKHGAVSQNQVVETGAYGLACETVFHAVGPNGRKETEHRKFHAQLKAVYKELFYYAGKRVESIAVPLISSGVFAGNFTKEQCAAAMWGGLIAAAESGELGSVKEIHFVNYDQEDSVRAIVRAAEVSKFDNSVKLVRSAVSGVSSPVPFLRKARTQHPLLHADTLKYGGTHMQGATQIAAVRIVQRVQQVLIDASVTLKGKKLLDYDAQDEIGAESEAMMDTTEGVSDSQQPVFGAEAGSMMDTTEGVSNLKLIKLKSGNNDRSCEQLSNQVPAKELHGVESGESQNVPIIQPTKVARKVVSNDQSDNGMPTYAGTSNSTTSTVSETELKPAKVLYSNATENDQQYPTTGKLQQLPASGASALAQSTGSPAPVSNGYDRSRQRTICTVCATKLCQNTVTYMRLPCKHDFCSKCFAQLSVDRKQYWGNCPACGNLRKEKWAFTFYLPIGDDSIRYKFEIKQDQAAVGASKYVQVTIYSNNSLSWITCFDVTQQAHASWLIDAFQCDKLFQVYAGAKTSFKYWNGFLDYSNVRSSSISNPEKFCSILSCADKRLFVDLRAHILLPCKHRVCSSCLVIGSGTFECKACKFTGLRHQYVMPLKANTKMSSNCRAIVSENQSTPAYCLVSFKLQSPQHLFKWVVCFSSLQETIMNETLERFFDGQLFKSFGKGDKTLLFWDGRLDWL